MNDVMVSSFTNFLVFTTVFRLSSTVGIIVFRFV